MNPTHSKKWLALALALALLNGFFAGAQSNTVPGPTDYTSFSRFVTARNIFDPNRYPHNSTSHHVTYTPRHSSPSAPAFSLVGTMSYGKGMFAFFDGNHSDLRKVLYQSDTNGIAGFTVTDITLNGVTLQGGDKKETVPMKIGEIMRQEGSHWLSAGQGTLAAVSHSQESAAPSSAGNSSPDASAAAAPSPGLDANDTLKKLMEKRAQELK